MRPLLMRTAALLAVLAGGCTAPASEMSDAPAIRVESARAHITPTRVGAVYFTLVSTTTSEDRLLSAESSAARMVELHEVVQEGDVVRMVHRPRGFVIPARASLALEPGGRHLMLYSVQPETSLLDLTLRFERAGTVRLSVPVSAPGAL